MSNHADDKSRALRGQTNYELDIFEKGGVKVDARRPSAKNVLCTEEKVENTRMVEVEVEVEFEWQD